MGKRDQITKSRISVVYFTTIHCFPVATPLSVAARTPSSFITQLTMTHGTIDGALVDTQAQAGSLCEYYKLKEDYSLY